MIYIIKEIKNSEKINLKREFNYLNKKIFNNELTLNFPVIWKNLKRKAGLVMIHSKKIGKRVIDETIEYLAITDYYDFPVEEIINILIHEMIHVSLSQRKIYNDIGGYHGLIFTKELNRINNQFSEYNIKPTENVSDYEVESSKIKKIILKGFILQNDSFILFKKMNDRELEDFINIIKRQVKFSKEEFVIEYFESDNSFLQKFSIARSLKTALKRQYALDFSDRKNIENDILWKKIIKSDGSIIND